MQNIDNLRVSQDTKKYLRETVNPILEEVVTKLLVDRPRDAAKYMLDYLTLKLRKSESNAINAVCLMRMPICTFLGHDSVERTFQDFGKLLQRFG